MKGRLVAIVVASAAAACSLLTSLDDLGPATCDACADAASDSGDAGVDANCVLSVAPTLVTLDPDASAQITVNVTRSGTFTSPVVIAVNGTPPNVTPTALTVPANADAGVFSLTVGAAPALAQDLQVVSQNAECVPATLTLAVRGVLRVYDQGGTFAVPTTTYLKTLEVRAWGGGGGGANGGFDGCSQGGSGGGGGFVRANVDVVSGETLDIGVGAGGIVNGGGGGCSTVERSGTALLVAPGGGGGASGGNHATCGGSFRGGSGGGGGVKGSDGVGNSMAVPGIGGGFGLSTLGGAGGSVGGANGGPMMGGAGGSGKGGSGGCGIFGGGGGGAGTFVSPNTGGAGGGGGGAPLFGDGGAFVTGGVVVAGGNTDTSYDGDAGLGGQFGFTQIQQSPAPGHQGRVVVLVQ